MIADFSPAEHTEQVIRLWLEASRLAHGFIPMEYWQSTAPLVRDEILPNARTRVWLEEGAVAGFLSLVDGDHIGALFVAPEYQNRGIGKKLLEDCKEGRKLLTLAVYRENRGAERFYRREGFTGLEARTDPATGRPELLMAWRSPEGGDKPSKPGGPG